MNSLCLKRINKDLKELIESPLDGIGIISLDNDPKKYIVNIKIMSGVYEGYCIQLLLTFPDNYPIHPPKILIYPGQYLDNTYHHHIYISDLKDDKGRNFQKFCFDLLENDFLSTSSKEKTGWNPSYTISSFLLQVQTFLSNPDFPTGYIPPQQKIYELMKSMDNYENSFKIKNENNEESIITHTWKNPYPKMFFNNQKNIATKKKDEQKLKDIKESLTCYITKLNYIDDKSVLLGYPIKKKNNGTLIPIPEILSYEGYLGESSKNNEEGTSRRQYLVMSDDTRRRVMNAINNLNETEREQFLINEIRNNPYIRIRTISEIISYKSANNEFYDSWLPIYINEEHYKKNRTTILNYFSIVKYGNYGLKQYDFRPHYIFEILPNILGSMIKKISLSNVSSSFLKCFFQYALMFKKLQKEYNDIFIRYKKFYLDKHLRNAFICNEKIKIKKELLEFLTLFFLFYNEIGSSMKQKLLNYIKKLKQLIILKYFEKRINFDVENQNKFIKDLKTKNIFDKIVDIIFIDSGFLLFDGKNLILSEILRNKLIEQISTNFKELYSALDPRIKNKIKKILITELNLSEYFNIKNIFSESNILIKDYEDCNTNKKILPVFDYLKNKISDKNFCDNLEKNYGVSLDTEKYIKDLNNLKKNNKNKYFTSINLEMDDYMEDINELFLLSSLKNKFFESFQSKYSKFSSYKNDKIYPYVEICSYSNQFTFIFISKKINNLILKEKLYYKSKNIKKILKKKQINAKVKEEIKRERYMIKNSYDKKNNKIFIKNLKKNNIKRLLINKNYSFY